MPQNYEKFNKQAFKSKLKAYDDRQWAEKNSVSRRAAERREQMLRLMASAAPLAGAGIGAGIGAAFGDPMAGATVGSGIGTQAGTMMDTGADQQMQPYEERDAERAGREAALMSLLQMRRR